MCDPLELYFLEQFLFVLVSTPFIGVIVRGLLFSYNYVLYSSCIDGILSYYLIRVLCSGTCEIVYFDQYYIVGIIQSNTYILGSYY